MRAIEPSGKIITAECFQCLDCQVEYYDDHRCPPPGRLGGNRAATAGLLVLTAGLVLAPWGALQWAIYLIAAISWITVVQRVLHVRKQLVGGTNVEQR